MWIKEKSNAGFRFWCREFKSIFPSSHLSCAHIQANELTKGYIGKKFMKFWVVLVCGNMWPNRQKDSRHGDSRRVEFKENLQCCNFYPPKIISTERKDKCFFDNFPWSTKVLHPSKDGVLNSILNHQVLLIIIRWCFEFHYESGWTDCNLFPGESGIEAWGKCNRCRAATLEIHLIVVKSVSDKIRLWVKAPSWLLRSWCFFSLLWVSSKAGSTDFFCESKSSSLSDGETEILSIWDIGALHKLP